MLRCTADALQNLASNQLTGSIADSFVHTHILQLDLSNNLLQGELPQGFPARFMQVGARLARCRGRGGAGGGGGGGRQARAAPPPPHPL